VVSALALLVGVTAAFVVVQGRESCDPHRRVLHVVASPDIAPVVAAVGRNADRLEGEEDCSSLRVHAEAAADVLAGLQQGTARPDVWIPDSSLWLERATAQELLAPVNLGPVATRPLVVALSRALADRLVADGAPVQWDHMVAAVSTGEVVLDLTAPASPPSTVGVLLALKAAADQGPDPRGALTGLLRHARSEAVPGNGHGPLSVLDSSSDTAVPVPEQAVFDAASRSGTTPLVSVYPSAAGTPFDYPYAVLRPDGALGEMARNLLAALRDTEGQAELRGAGFRGPDGTGDGLRSDGAVDGSQPGAIAVPDLATADEVVRMLDAVHRRTRLLAVVDVSGSMAETVPEAGGSTRLDVALRAASGGLELYPDSTEVGLWSFSEDLTASSDYQELVPISPLTAPFPGGREGLAQAVTQLRPVADGGTGLYDTALAAVRAVRVGWDPTYVNAVLLLSDGADTDDDGIGLEQLLAALRNEDPARPVPIITISYGNGDGAEALAAMSEATGGASYQMSDPSRIRDVFLDAVGQRACRPECPPSPAG